MYSSALSYYITITPILKAVSMIKANADGSFDIFGPSDGPSGHYHLGRDKDGNYFGHG